VCREYNGSLVGWQVLRFGPLGLALVEAESTRYRSRSWRGGEASVCRSLAALSVGRERRSRARLQQT